MTREEIREGIEKIRKEALGNDCSAYLTDTILAYLDSQGVVIKYEKDDVGCGGKLCLEGTGLSKEIVEPLI